MHICMFLYRICYYRFALQLWNARLRGTKSLLSACLSYDEPYYSLRRSRHAHAPFLTSKSILIYKNIILLSHFGFIRRNEYVICFHRQGGGAYILNTLVDKRSGWLSPISKNSMPVTKYVTDGQKRVFLIP